jgi:hypothetical protein
VRGRKKSRAPAQKKRPSLLGSALFSRVIRSLLDLRCLGFRAVGRNLQLRLAFVQLD